MVFQNEGGPATATNFDLYLLGQFLADRTIRVSVMKEMMANVWRPNKGITFTETGKGSFLFQFYQRLDLERVEEGGPWSFDGYLMVIGRVHM